LADSEPIEHVHKTLIFLPKNLGEVDNLSDHCGPRGALEAEMGCSAPTMIVDWWKLKKIACIFV
jgi:hypothetical protein